jgi:hypothetical protein
MAIPPQQHAEIIEPSDNALQLYTVHEKYGQRSFLLPYMIKESVL